MHSDDFSKKEKKIIISGAIYHVIDVYDSHQNTSQTKTWSAIHTNVKFNVSSRPRPAARSELTKKTNLVTKYLANLVIFTEIFFCQNNQ